MESDMKLDKHAHKLPILCRKAADMALRIGPAYGIVVDIYAPRI